jgi:hypothetical protein
MVNKRLGWVLLSLALGASGQELLRNPGLEGGGKLASGWTELAWGQPKPAYACAGAEPHGGARSQRITFTTLPEKSGLVYRQPFTFLGGHTYRGRVWLRSPDRARVQVLMRRSKGRSPSGLCPCGCRTIREREKNNEVKAEAFIKRLATFVVENHMIKKGVQRYPGRDAFRALPRVCKGVKLLDILGLSERRGGNE